MAVPFDPFSLEELPDLKFVSRSQKPFLFGLLMGRFNFHYRRYFAASKSTFKIREPERRCKEVLDHVLQECDRIKSYLQQFGLGRDTYVFLEKIKAEFNSKRHVLENDNEQKKLNKDSELWLLPWPNCPSIPDLVTEFFSTLELPSDELILVALGFQLEQDSNYFILHSDGRPLVSSRARTHFTLEPVGFCLTKEAADYVLTPDERLRPSNATRLSISKQADWWFDLNYYYKIDFLDKYLIFLKEGISRDGWQGVVNNIWDHLGKIDRVKDGFSVYSFRAGWLLVRGEPYCEIGERSQPYKFLKFVITTLKRDPIRRFNNIQIMKAVGTTDDSIAFKGFFDSLPEQVKNLFEVCLHKNKRLGNTLRLK